MIILILLTSYYVGILNSNYNLSVCLYIKPKYMVFIIKYKSNEKSFSYRFTLVNWLINKLANLYWIFVHDCGSRV